MLSGHISFQLSSHALLGRGSKQEIPCYYEDMHIFQFLLADRIQSVRPNGLDMHSSTGEVP